MNFRKTLAVGILAVLAFQPAGAKAEPYDLRGYKLGMTLDEFRSMAYPDPGKYDNLKTLCTGDPIPPRVYGASRLRVSAALTKSGVVRCKHFAPQKLGSLVSTKEAAFDVAGVGTFTDFEFAPEDGGAKTLRLFRINVASNMRYWDQFWSAYRQKFGEPTKVENGAVQNNYGATFSKIVARWVNKESSIKLEQRDGNIKTMRIVYLHDALAETVAARLKTIDGSPANKL